ncbi:MAG: sigma 54-interacting transcriptional regulator [Pirellulaceae bacterium]|nr:sigma 54-interacting transcriptional regulator [Pirellulaceae bacterium]
MTPPDVDRCSELEERLRFETLITDLSVKFIDLPASHVDREITEAQRCVCEFLGLDLSALWQASAKNPALLILTHLYRSFEGNPIPQQMSADEYFPWCQRQLLAGKVIRVSSLDELPREATRDGESWRHYGIKTTLTVPLSVGGGPTFGALSFNTTREKRQWPDDMVKRLQLVAQVFANALARKRFEETLRESEERLNLAADSAGAGLWSLDLATRCFWLTAKTRELFGFSADEEVTFGRFLDVVHPEDRDLIQQTVQTLVRSNREVFVEYRVLPPDGSLRWFASRGRVQSRESGEPDCLLGVSVDVTDRKRAELAIKDRLRFESLLADLSARFVNQPAEQVAPLLDGTLQTLVDFLGNDRSTLIEFGKKPRHIQVTHSYAVPGCEAFPVGPFAINQLPWFIGQFRLGKAVFVRNLPDELPPEAIKERDYCRMHGIQSNVAVPLKVGGSVLGAITFAFIRRRCEWPAEILSRLQLIGEVFANAILRRRTEESLREALAENMVLRQRLEQENQYLREQAVLKYHHGRIIGRSEAITRVLSEAERVAATDAPVLLLGETGTGKELLAQTIHELSARKNQPMVIVNCASLPATLIESELFGREAGAYTGAASAQVGRFVVADGSTLFLDEVGEFPVELQAKLLRVLQDGRFERLGSPKTVTVDVRIIAATNRNLDLAVREEKFRADLYHRLNVFPIRVPPLRERREDIPPLAWAFVESFGRRMGKTIKSIPRKTMQQLQQYSWPGNVRELSNVIERAMILASGDELHVDLPTGTPDARATRMTLEENQREQILRALQNTGWRIRGTGGAAEILGIKPTTLEARMAKLGIRRPNRDSNIS